MRFSRDLNRRTFLKLGLTGTAAAALSPPTGLASVRANRTFSSPPTLADMASARLTYRLRDPGKLPPRWFRFQRHD
jgi:TAT (twin-arginine translocation) pathway signal sequence